LLKRGEGICDFGDHGDGLVQGECALSFESVAEAVTVHVRHDQMEEAVGLPRVEEGQNVGM